MYRIIYRPTSESELFVKLPADFINKEIEVIAFDVIEKSEPIKPIQTEEERRSGIKKMLDGFPKFNMSNFKFDRNEANDYE